MNSFAYHLLASVAVVTAALIAPVPIMAQQSDEAARLFGQREGFGSVNISPDGAHVVFIAASEGTKSIAMVAPVAGGKPSQVAVSDGEPYRLTWCDWVTNQRLICQLYGVTDKNQVNTIAPFTRLVAFNIDGSAVVPLSPKTRKGFLYDQQFDGNVISWLDDGTALISRYHLPERTEVTQGSSRFGTGLAVDRVDLSDGSAKSVEFPDEDVILYLADREGKVRIKGEKKFATKSADSTYTYNYFYRKKGQNAWLPLSTVTGNIGLSPIAMAEGGSAVYAVGTNNGRQALYRVALTDGTPSELIVANDKVDIDGVEVLGKRGKVFAASWTTDRRERRYFDPRLQVLSEQLVSELPGNPEVYFESASDDGKKIVVFATSDVDPGRFYVVDTETMALTEMLSARPTLRTMALAAVKPVRYKSPDGTEIPAYLTLPNGSDGKGLPAIVMPHGGPSSRDDWGFDWLAQFFASRGYAVLQPNYRGSSGYGDEWFVNNGFRSWDVAMSDINAGAKWMIDQGIADAEKMAIVGWSYGGYAALQGSVTNPQLYKAVVAIAPVTDLQMLVNDSRGFSSYRSVRDFIGTGDHIELGSPRRQASRMVAPVLMFSGDHDLNVDVRHAREMEKALKQAGKDVRLVIYKGLDHQLPDSDARKDMLSQADSFLRKSLKIAE